MSSKAKLAIVMLVKVMVVLTIVVRSTVTFIILSHRQWLKKRSGGYRLGYRLPSHISHGKFRHKCRSSIDLLPQKIFVDRIGFDGSPIAFRGFLAKSDIPRLLLTTSTGSFDRCSKKGRVQAPGSSGLGPTHRAPSSDIAASAALFREARRGVRCHWAPSDLGLHFEGLGI